MNMDIAVLVNFLAPCLPFLMGLGQKAVDKAAEKLGEKGTEALLPQGKKIWDKLRPKVEVKESALEAATDVAKNPDDDDAIAALRQQLKKILEAPENANLAKEITDLLAQPEIKDAIQFQQQVSGDRNQVIGVVKGGSINYNG